MRHGRAHRKRQALAGLALLLAAAACYAQVYKWKDERGVTHYGDRPPAGRSAQALDALDAAAPASGIVVLPYELARAAESFPVVLYTSASCDACDQGRALLRERGIPFSERTVGTRADEEQLRAVSGRNDVPLLLVGSRQLGGFQAETWQEALDTASYPRTSRLPPGYVQATPRPAAPVPAQGAVRATIKVPPDVSTSPAPQRPPPRDDTPPDFQF